ncbi:LysE family translocator [Aquincola sp. S2]|uniref:LysE family translocator n=1 Tax=Pseudaquabacterium terrae TaxID=2732868 RepID=A0ABX2ETP6_9BURK|nr:LysE family translocator [Aquabacterium terrae]NRF72031.1 LysE family translocator [Aquabacterium terrae]
MIDYQTLPLYLSAVVVLLLVPGPDMLLISVQSIRRGFKYGAACSLGVMLAGLLQTALVALGLGRLMESWPLAATVLRLLGACYFGFLGIRMLMAWHKARPSEAAPAAGVVEQKMSTLVAVGLLNNLLNPKALLFFSLFLPQFVNSSLGNPSLQLAVLGLLLTFLAFAFNLLASALFALLRSFRPAGPSLQRHGNGLLGLLFVFLASRLALAKTA